MKFWEDYNSYVPNYYTFENFYSNHPEINCLKNNLTKGKYINTIISGNRGNGVTHLLHAACNEFFHNGKKVIYITAQWLVYIYKRIRSDIELNEFINFMLSFDMIAIDNTQFMYRKSKRLIQFIINLFEICTDEGKVIFFGCSEPNKDFTKMKKYSKLFFMDRIVLISPSGENVFRILKHLCEHEPLIPEKLLYLISGYNGSVQQYVNCLIVIRFKSKAERILLDSLEIEEIENEFAIKKYFPKQQFRKCFINVQRLLWDDQTINKDIVKDFY